ncbi:MAG: DUF1028 domain-containing protein, partial [Ignavibacteria bacterium]|nr:DUF1028 domain-containing protein [Ignavibacteria bacterium]
AGASCVNDCTILTDVHPGWGVVHTQASWNPNNQNYARQLMDRRLPPQEIIDSVTARDATGNPSIRQYGIVDLFESGRSAGFTGANCLDYKNHILGPTYAIQGNILSGQPILDSMRARFLRQSGSLADKLMAALQGANVIGADTRCASWNTSSKSAFIRVARPGDTLGTLYLNLRVLNAPFGREPIDSLQVLYNQWITTGVNQLGNELPSDTRLIGNYPNPFNPSTTIQFDIAHNVRVTLRIYDLSGREVEVLVDEYLSAGSYAKTFDARGLASGIYFYSLTAGDYSQTRRMALVK